MNLISRSIVLLAIMMLLCTLFLLPASTGADIVGLIEDDEIPQDDDDVSFINSVPIAWTRIPVHQLSFLLKLGISIFALFVVYLGGRSKAKRFNDRTIELNKFLIYIFSKTALNRAVFNFPFLDPLLQQMSNKFLNVFFPIKNPYLRSD